MGSNVSRMGKQSAEVSETRGRHALAKALETRGWSQADLAREIKCDTGLVNRWLHGRRVPGRHWSGVLDRVLGVKPSLWGAAPLEKTG